MWTKKTLKNQITLPKVIISRFPGIEYFDITEENGKIILAPLKLSRTGEVREKLKLLGIDECDIKDAIDWSRKT